eukprot:642471-Prymnesium_polylepis.1
MQRRWQLCMLLVVAPAAVAGHFCSDKYHANFAACKMRASQTTGVGSPRAPSPARGAAAMATPSNATAHAALSSRRHVPPAPSGAKKRRRFRTNPEQLSTYKATVGKFTIRQRGEKSAGLWGLEHYPVLRHVAKAAAGPGSPCVLIEAGAHQGTLALLGGMSNCTVHGFDAVLRHLQMARSNVALNRIPPERLRFVHRKLGDSAGFRLDELVPSTGRISLLKMDIDGMDAIAMRGASGLFQGAGVDVINLEFSPTKHFESAKVSDADYLRELHAKGYEAYLDNCYKHGLPQLEQHISRALGGALCLAVVAQGGDEETAAQSLLFGCLIGGSCPRDALALARRQHIPADKYGAFADAVARRDRRGEVDLVLVKPSGRVLPYTPCIFVVFRSISSDQRRPRTEAEPPRQGHTYGFSCTRTVRLTCHSPGWVGSVEKCRFAAQSCCGTSQRCRWPAGAASVHGVAGLGLQPWHVVF